MTASGAIAADLWEFSRHWRPPSYLIDATEPFLAASHEEVMMAEELSYGAEAAAEYDRAFLHVSTYYLPFLLRAAQVRPAQHVLDVATGTGVAAEAALTVIGAKGSIIAADISPDMVEKARQRLGRASNAVVAVEDGQALSFPDRSFDVVLCSLGLMFFPNPLRGLCEFRRVLRPGGRTAVSVMTTPDHSYNGRINVVVARYVPSLAEATARTFALGKATRLQSLFLEAGFANVETHTERHNFMLPSFDAYYGPFERGGASTGQALASLPEVIRRAIREEVRLDLGDTGGPIEIELEVRFASGWR